MAIIQEKNKQKWTKDGRSWYFDIRYFDIYGNRKEKKSKLFKNKKDAKDAEIEFINSIKENKYTNANISFEELFNEWISFKKETIKSTTGYRLDKNLKKNILDYFIKFKLNSIKINVIKDWKIWLNEKGNTLKYQNSIIGYLKEILEYAKDNYDFDVKIISKIQKYRIETVSNKKKESEWNFWTYDEFSNFISNVDDSFYNLVFNFLYYTGLREGEMIALTWNDIDLNNKKLRINKSFTNKIGNDTYCIVDPKTKNSIRILDLDDSLIRLIKKHKKNEENIYGFNNDWFIFGNVKYISPTTLARYLNKYIEITKYNNNNFHKITPHGFRHSHVSLLINLGCDSRDVAERIGDTVQTVESTYYHMFPNKKSNTIKALNNFKNAR